MSLTILSRLEGYWVKLTIPCDWCGIEISRYPSQIKRFNFCCRKCLADYSNKTRNPEGYKKLKDYTKMSEHLSKLNQEINPSRMTPQTRQKLRDSRLGSGNGVTYAKYFGVHEHRVVAEKLLGRALTDEEVVHHVDGNKRNNDPENLMVLPSQSEHAKLHMRERVFWNGGDAQ